MLKFSFIFLALCTGCIHKTGISDLNRRQPTQALVGTTQNLKASQLVQFDTGFLKNIKHSTQFLSHKEKTKKSILIMHGLHESPFYMNGLAQYFFSKGYNVLNLRLPGHGTGSVEDLNQVQSSDWIAAANEALKAATQLSDSVEVLGYSTGGTLAAYLALKNPNLIKKIYMIAPALALSTRVFLSTQVLGRTGLDLSKVCRPEMENRFLCRMVLNLDDQLAIMLKEGIYSSPPAGLQVQNLIHRIQTEFSENRDSVYIPERSQTDYYKDLKEIYHRIKIPLFMVNSEADVVVLPYFNQDVVETHSGSHRNILFSKKFNISHIQISKSKSDAFKSDGSVYNSQFDEIIQGIEIFNQDSL